MKRARLPILLMLTAAVIIASMSFDRPPVAGPPATQLATGGAATVATTAPGILARARPAVGSSRTDEGISELEWAIPMLAHEPKARQLETLRWLRTVPEDKVLSAFTELVDDHGTPVALRRDRALRMIDAYIEALERESVEAPRSDDVVAAQVVEVDFELDDSR